MVARTVSNKFVPYISLVIVDSAICLASSPVVHDIGGRHLPTQNL